MEDEVIAPEHFDEQLGEVTQHITRMLSTKAGEYATHVNRYHNFVLCKMLAGMAVDSSVTLTIPQVIWFLCIKHVASCMDLIRGIAFGKKFKASYIDEKFGDFVSYLYLLWIFIRTKHSIDEDDD